jgi:hypothetical protein
MKYFQMDPMVKKKQLEYFCPAFSKNCTPRQLSQQGVIDSFENFGEISPSKQTKGVKQGTRLRLLRKKQQ